MSELHLRFKWPLITLVALFVLCAFGVSAQAQAPAKPEPASPKNDLVANWNDVGRKLIAMAEDFPEDKYDWKPTPEIRSFAEQLLHAAGSTYYFHALAQGQRPSEADPSRSQFKSKAEIVAYVKKAFADGAGYIKAYDDASLSKPFQVGRRSVTPVGLWSDAIEHSGEHYGQLVLYYRVNKMVPPESRPRK